MESIRNELLAYVEALWRRRWFAVVVAWLLAMVGWGVVAILPDQYRSSSQIYVETQSLLGPLLKNLAVDSTDSRAEVLVMQRTLLSRPNLEKVARATDLHLRANDPVAVEKLLESINSHTSVTMDAPNLFTVSFTDADAQMAKEVVQKLINIFVESNLGQSRADMENARAFIERQIAQYEAQLKAADQRIAEFRGQNVNILSGNVTFAARLEMTRQSVIEARLALEDSISRRDQLAANLKTIPQTMDGPAMAVGASPQAARVAELQKSLDAMKLRGFTDEHPDVAATRRALDQAMSEGGGRGGGGYSVSRMSNPLYEQIKLRLVDAEATVATAQRRVQQTQQDSERLKEMAQAAPGIEAQLADMQREYGVLRSNYEQLLSR
ncbi:MAG: hypothetical protein K2Q10_08095, partial [Rhodospirillales bacterium]|nr:hypothetical protein [Rhodospirillales bacterium]